MVDIFWPKIPSGTLRVNPELVQYPTVCCKAEGANNLIVLALSQRLLVLGFIFRFLPSTFVKITSGRFYRLSHFLV